MDENLKDPLKKLADVLHRVISGSPEVEQALLDVRNGGVQPYLVLEVTVALARDDDGESEELDVNDVEETDEDQELASEQAVSDVIAELDPDSGPLEMRITPDDQEYLRSLRIKLES